MRGWVIKCYGGSFRSILDLCGMYIPAKQNLTNGWKASAALLFGISPTKSNVIFLLVAHTQCGVFPNTNLLWRLECLLSQHVP